MKNLLFQGTLFLLLCSATTFAQNKSLAVGTATANPNAALHVESPTNNQGIIIPRLTTAQRSSFTGALNAGDVGLLVFDTDLRALTIWNGTSWDVGSKTGEPLTATSTGAAGNAGTFTITNVSNNDVAINGTTTGTGHAAYFEINNASNANAALFVGTNGNGNAITANGTIQANSFVGDGSGLTNLPAGGWGLNGNTGTTPGTDFIGTSDAQDVVFKANNAEAVRILSSGQVGIGSTPVSAKLDVSSANTIIGIHAATSAPSGVQNRGLQADAAGSSAQNIGVYGTGFIDGSNGAIGVYGEAIGNGISDAFGLYGTTNNFTATTGKTFGVYASAENGSVNWAGYFDKGNVHIKNALSVGLTDGTYGTTGQVLTSQGSATAPTWSPLLPYAINTPSAGTLLDVTNSSGGMAASFTSANGSQSLYVLNTGTGRAGMFNANPSSEGVLTAQSGGTGPSLSLFHLANGNAIDIQSGGLRLSNTTVVAPTTITTKAILYRVTGTGNVNLIGGAQIGETCWVSNETATAIDINGAVGAVGPNSIRQFIFIGSGWRIVN